MLKKLSSDSVFTLVVFVLLCLSYFPLWNGDFIGDDIGRIQQLPKSQAFSLLMNGLGDRPLLSLSVWFDRFFLGMTPGMMRLESIIFASALALLMRKIAREVSDQTGEGFNDIWRDLIIIAAILHPLNSQTFGHVIQRGIILSTLGAMLSTYWLLKAKFDFRSVYTKGAILAWILALLCKPNIAFFPVFWLIMMWQLGHIKLWKSLVPFFLAIGLPLLSYFFSGFNQQTTLGAPIDYFLTQGEVLLLYFKLILFPVGLKFNHDFIAYRNTPLFPGLLYWSLILVSFSVIVWKVKSKAFKLFVVAMFLSFLPESSFFPIIHGAFEHRTFTAICLLGIAFAGIGVKKLSNPLKVTTLIVIAVFITLNIRRSNQTKSLKDWALTELSHTCKVEYLALYNLEIVLAYNMHKEAEHVLRNVRKCSPERLTDTVLWSYFNIVTNDKITPTSLRSAAEVLHSDYPLNNSYRRFATHALISAIGKKINCSGKTQTCHEHYCMREEFLSNQLRAFLSDSYYFYPEISNYIATAKGCLDEISNLTDPDSIFHKYKIRTIAAVYFDAKEGGLDSELDKAEKSERYDYLRTLLKNYRAKKISPNAPNSQKADQHR